MLTFRVETEFDVEGGQWFVKIVSSGDLVWEGWVLGDGASCWDAMRAAIKIYEESK
jgi:hypothetical protein